MSFGFEGRSQSIHKAILYAQDEGLIMSAATSNDGNRSADNITFLALDTGLVFGINTAMAYGKEPEYNLPLSRT